MKLMKNTQLSANKKHNNSYSNYSWSNDLRVPFTQGQEFYRALDRLGIDTEMVVYPRTPHGPREPKFLMDVSDRILTWFEKYK